MTITFANPAPEGHNLTVAGSSGAVVGATVPHEGRRLRQLLPRSIILAPGLGEVRWDRFCAALYAVGYDRWISIEHEDRGFEGDVELVKRGFLIARDALRPYVH